MFVVLRNCSCPRGVTFLQAPKNYLRPMRSYYRFQGLSHCLPSKARYKHSQVLKQAASSVDAIQSFPKEEKVLVDDVKSKEENKWVTATPDLKTRIKLYLRLSKAKLSSFVVISAMAGYALAPGSFDIVGFSCLAAGTSLCSGAANSFNQFIEVPFDSQMSRTRNRVLVQGLLQPKEAFLFGTIASLVGISVLSLGNNALTGVLGALNIILYAGIYTASKRQSIANTWIGSVVGGIPPLMGWAAATGDLGLGAWVLAGILYCWQFPHFNALSWSYRPDYSRAGYRMMAVTDPALCRRVTVRHSVAQIPLSLMLPILDVTNWWFMLTVTPVNLYLTYLSWRFYKDSNNNSSRKLFRFSLAHLPLVMALALVHMKRKDKTDNAIDDVIK
ncbi:protoheme IX farnesyltransferase, mitochondrial-like [Rhopilema esculentum]|uniref:protoheme IX farnesyltransferase, mitochondrial-like n=1 Tax=Rhopilema esculentum TaxID=499914 RepID=UPI0031DD0DA7